MRVRRGMVLVVDDEDRENEGVLIMAAEYVSTDTVAFLASCSSTSVEKASRKQGTPVTSVARAAGPRRISLSNG